MKKLMMMAVMMMLSVLMVMPAHAAKAKLNIKNANMNVGETLQLKVKGKRKKANWKSSNKSVAVVSRKGKVTAKAPGSAKISVKIGRKKLTCWITVFDEEDYTDRQDSQDSQAGDDRTQNVQPASNHWKYTGNVYNVFEWTNLANCNQQQAMNIVKARPYELYYNAKNELVAKVAVVNLTPGRNYYLNQMKIGIYNGRSKIAEAFITWDNYCINPNTVGIVSMTFDQNTTHQVIDLNRTNWTYRIATN